MGWGGSVVCDNRLTLHRYRHKIEIFSGRASMIYDRHACEIKTNNFALQADFSICAPLHIHRYSSGS